MPLHMQRGNGLQRPVEPRPALSGSAGKMKGRSLVHCPLVVSAIWEDEEKPILSIARRKERGAGEIRRPLVWLLPQGGDGGVRPIGRKNQLC